MIYMREKTFRKKEVAKDEKKSFIDQLRIKILKKGPENQNKINKPKNTSKKQTGTENTFRGNQASLDCSKFKIDKQIYSGDSKFSQSIIIHDTPQDANPSFNKKQSLQIVKCLDIKILNELSSSRYRVQAYVQMLEQQRNIKANQISSLKRLLTDSNNEQSFSKIESIKSQLKQSETSISKYCKYFEEGKDLFLSIAMQLLGIRNQLGNRMTDQSKRNREKSINKLIQKIQKTISFYTEFIHNKFKRVSDEVLNIEELWNNVKYQQKIIQLMKQNESNLKTVNQYHENKLLRYEINRLSHHNQQLLKILSITGSKDAAKADVAINTSFSLDILDQSDLLDSEGEGLIEQNFSQLQDEILQNHGTPFKRINSEQQAQSIKEIQQYKKRVVNLQVEKEYILDQLQQLQKANIDLQNQLKTIIHENFNLKEQLAGLTTSYQVSKETERAIAEQNELLKEKIKLIFKPNGKQTATVQELFKLLNRKDLIHYHQALMELISQYQQRISDLTNNFVHERQLKEQSLQYCKGLLSLVQTKNNQSESAKLEDLVSYISSYDQILEKLNQNEIDVYLRKIKSFSIGIDEQALKVIGEELRDYIYQLQTRLPTLTEEYFEDGSSILDSAQI